MTFDRISEPRFPKLDVKSSNLLARSFRHADSKCQRAFFVDRLMLGVTLRVDEHQAGRGLFPLLERERDNDGRSSHAQTDSPHDGRLAGRPAPVHRHRPRPQGTRPRGVDRNQQLLPAQDRGTRARLPGHLARLRLGGRPERDAADHGPPLGHDASPSRPAAAGLARVLRGQLSCSRGRGPAGFPPAQLCHPTRRREEGDPLGFIDADPGRPLFGLRPTVAPGSSRSLEDAPLSRAGFLESLRPDSQASHALVGPPSVSSPLRAVPTGRGDRPPWRCRRDWTGDARRASDAGCTMYSQPRIHRLALQGEHGEDALVDSAQRLAADEPLQRLDANGELAQCE